MPRPSLADASARQPELQGARTASGNPPFMRRCLTLALQLRGLTYRELFAYAVLVSHCRAFVDGDHGICTLLYSTWATEAGVFRPRPGEDAGRIISPHGVGATRDAGDRQTVWRQVLLPLNDNYSCRLGRVLPGTTHAGGRTGGPAGVQAVRWALLRVLKKQKTKRSERPLGDVHVVR